MSGVHKVEVQRIQRHMLRILAAKPASQPWTTAREVHGDPFAGEREVNVTSKRLVTLCRNDHAERRPSPMHLGGGGGFVYRITDAGLDRLAELELRRDL